MVVVGRRLCCAGVSAHALSCVWWVCGFLFVVPICLIMCFVCFNFWLLFNFLLLFLFCFLFDVFDSLFFFKFEFWIIECLHFVCICLRAACVLCAYLCLHFFERMICLNFVCVWVYSFFYARTCYVWLLWWWFVCAFGCATNSQYRLFVDFVFFCFLVLYVFDFLLTFVCIYLRW